MDAAVIGCGRMGAFTSEGVRKFAPECWFPLAHAEAIEAADGLDLVALCDPNEEGLARAAERYGVARTYPDHRALLADGAPALAGIATRTIGRADIISDCFEAGVRAFHIEKPICNSVAELRRLEEIFARDDVFVTLGAVRRHFAIYRDAVTRASSGDYGQLLEARVDMGPGALFWAHPHSVDLILLAAAGREVQSVQARLGEVERDGDTIVNDPAILAASVWFEDGFAGHISRAHGIDFHLSCERARFAVMNDGHSLAFAAADDANPYPATQQVEFDAGNAAQGALAPMLQLTACLEGDAAARAANTALKRDIVRGQEVLFAFVQSHLDGGAPVALADIDPAMTILGRTGQFYA
ncbi:hypothetical protein GCM10010923_23290 [Blastomonas marina]|uniref:Gfo/Idh/MocA-like oxidoreductase N-terminal domain-containing protein n=1 Tax=Blastomonas marina TaxID=1867408 RepID=A0ABQ1FH70_9SPHN|nr:Gfo/Idh/MocA family oxidoreductase [Blastomonas marina]GGA11956.1 hypothetical protein GCM10010923_23290 [Blastomonas marina]